MSNKAGIRKEKLDFRKGLTETETNAMSMAIQDKIIASLQFKECDIILAYAPLGNEVDTANVIERALELGKEVYLPRVESKDNSLMKFYKFMIADKLNEGSYGIKEPQAINEFKYDSSKKVLMLVPGVSFDYAFNRIGFGKGFYDNFLKGKSGIFKCALSYAGQLVEHIDSDENDILMDAVITESEIYYRN